MKTWKQSLDQLKKLRDACGSNIFQAAKIAVKLVKDTDFIAEYGEGDEFTANEKLFNECFPHLNGIISLLELLRLIEAYPSESKWQEYHYNLVAMVELYNDQHKDDEDKEKRTVKRATLAQLQEANDRIAALESFNKERQSNIDALRTENEKLKVEVAKLQGQLEELRRMMKIAA